MRRSLGVLAIIGALGLARGAAAAETVVPCDAFKSRWAAAAAGPAAPVFDKAPRRPGPERVALGPEVEAEVTCREGALTHLDLRQPAGAAPGGPAFGSAAAAILRALEGELTPTAAGQLVDALRAEAAVRRTATSSWGPYEITLVQSGPGAAPELSVDFAEN